MAQGDRAAVAVDLGRYPLSTSLRASMGGCGSENWGVNRHPASTLFGSYLCITVRDRTLMGNAPRVRGRRLCYGISPGPCPAVLRLETNLAVAWGLSGSCAQLSGRIGNTSSRSSLHCPWQRTSPSSNPTCVTFRLVWVQRFSAKAVHFQRRRQWSLLGNHQPGQSTLLPSEDTDPGSSGHTLDRTEHLC